MTECGGGSVAASGRWRSRRDVLRGAASAGILPFVASPASYAAVLAPSVAGIYKVAFNDRHSAGRAFGRSMAAAGYNTVSVGDDVTDFWYHDLHQQWRQQPAAIAGLTSLRAAFCLEGLAGDVWMRPVYRGEHDLAPNGVWRHRFQGEQAITDSAVVLDGSADWGDGIARILRAAAGRRMAQVRPLISAAAPHSAGAAEPLISWLIVPRRHA